MAYYPIIIDKEFVQGADVERGAYNSLACIARKASPIWTPENPVRYDRHGLRNRMTTPRVETGLAFLTAMPRLYGSIDEARARCGHSDVASLQAAKAQPPAIA